MMELEIETSTWTYHTTRDIDAWRDLWVSRLIEARLGQRAAELGFADQAELQDLAEGWRAWASSERPFFAFLHGEVIAAV